MTTLRFLGSGGFQREVGDLHGIKQGTVSKNIHKVIRQIALLQPKYVIFPTADEYDEIQRQFFQQRGFPGKLKSHLELLVMYT